MSKSRVGPEAKIITLFTALPEDSKRIVLDVIKSQATTRQAKVKARKAGGAVVEGVWRPDFPSIKRDAPIAQMPNDSIVVKDKTSICAVCGQEEGHADHDRAYIQSHPFVVSFAQPSVPGAGKRSPRRAKVDKSVVNSLTKSDDAGIVLPDDPEDFHMEVEA